jgi:2-hydroxy-3-oxopropionate reductase
VFEFVGFIGVGMMGTPMLRNLVEAGHNVVAYDIDPEAMRRAEEGGAEVASSLREIAETCDPVITILPRSDDVEEVVLGPGGILEHGREGQVLIDMTTAYPLSTKRIAGALSEKGMRMLDAPVSGGVTGAEKGTLSIMVGGDTDLFELCRPLLEAMGRNIFHMGGVGSGHTMKAVNNFLSACTVTATSEAMALATKAGLKPRRRLQARAPRQGPRHLHPAREGARRPHVRREHGPADRRTREEQGVREEGAHLHRRVHREVGGSQDRGLT